MSAPSLSDKQLEKILIDATTEGDNFTREKVPDHLLGMDAMTALKRVRDHYEPNANDDCTCTGLAGEIFTPCPVHPL